MPQVDFFRNASNDAMRNGREIRSVNPNTIGSHGLRRPTGWVVVVMGGSHDPCYMYVAITDDGSWQRVDAGTGTLG